MLKNFKNQGVYNAFFCKHCCKPLWNQEFSNIFIGAALMSGVSRKTCHFVRTLFRCKLLPQSCTLELWMNKAVRVEGFG